MAETVQARTMAEEFKALAEKATQGTVDLPHICDDSHTCNCCTICDEGYASGIATVVVGNDLPIGEGGIDGPSKEEAAANAAFIAWCFNHRTEIAAALNTPGAVDAKGAADRIVRDVAELPDRTSPEDQPDMLLVTEAELRAIILSHTASAPAPAGMRERFEAWFRRNYPRLSLKRYRDAGEYVMMHAKWMWAAWQAAQSSPPATSVTPNGEADEDEAYEIGKQEGYAKAVQDIDVATGGDGEFCGSTFPGGTVDVPVMKQRIIDRFSVIPATKEWRCRFCGGLVSFDGTKPELEERPGRKLSTTPAATGALTEEERLLVLDTTNDLDDDIEPTLERTYSLLAIITRLAPEKE